MRGLSEVEAARIVEARAAGPFRSVEEVWRRSCVPVAALEKLANADAFRSLGLDRRQALWAVKGLADTELPLFAAADARAGFAPVAREPAVALRPMTEGREVVEDYRHLQLTLRAHPLAFLRGELNRRRIVRASDLRSLKDGRHVEVAGIILVRQKPGSAKGVLFITIEDETGVANIILWPDRFERQRRVVLSSAMISVRGKLQREGEVIHVIADLITDETDMLRRVGDMAFPHKPGPGDGATHGGPDERDRKRIVPAPADHFHPPFADGCDPEAAIRVRTRDFH